MAPLRIEETIGPSRGVAKFFAGRDLVAVAAYRDQGEDDGRRLYPERFLLTLAREKRPLSGPEATQLFDWLVSATCSTIEDFGWADDGDLVILGADARGVDMEPAARSAIASFARSYANANRGAGAKLAKRYGDPPPELPKKLEPGETRPRQERARKLAGRSKVETTSAKPVRLRPEELGGR